MSSWKVTHAGAALPPDVRKRSALPFRFLLNPGLRPQRSGVAQADRLAGRPKAFRTSDGIAGDFLGKAAVSNRSQLVNA